MNKSYKLAVVGSVCFVVFLFGAATSVIIRAQNESTVAAPSFTPPSFSFIRDLQLGVSGQDVRQLQILLNNNLDTQISATGAGSKGNESTYFGALTQNAVKRFQNKNKINPSGYVGPLTKAKLNQIISTSPLPVAVTASSTLATTSTSFPAGAQPLAKEHLPRLYTTRPQQVKRGDVLTLVGDGFQLDNTVYIGSLSFPNTIPQDNSNISLKIPTTMMNGTYTVRVENKLGSSQMSGQNIQVTVTDSPKTGPVISSVTPANVSLDTVITVIGYNLSPNGNTIFSGYGSIGNVSSDGTKITFTPRDLLSRDFVNKLVPGGSIKLDFYILNADAQESNVFGSVLLKI